MPLYPAPDKESPYYDIDKTPVPGAVASFRAWHSNKRPEGSAPARVILSIARPYNIAEFCIENGLDVTAFDAIVDYYELRSKLSKRDLSYLDFQRNRVVEEKPMTTAAKIARKLLAKGEVDLAREVLSFGSLNFDYTEIAISSEGSTKWMWSAGCEGDIFAEGTSNSMEQAFADIQLAVAKAKAKAR